jgi:hypothetical protein
VARPTSNYYNRGKTFIAHSHFKQPRRANPRSTSADSSRAITDRKREHPGRCDRSPYAAPLPSEPR